MSDRRQGGSGGGTTMRSFELHVFKDGVWKIDSIFDDAELALLEARRADEGKRYASIRVIEERYDEQTDRTTLRTLFRGGVVPAKGHGPAPAAAGKRAAAAAGPSGGVGKDPMLHHKEPQARKPSTSLLLPVLVLLLVICGGAAVLFGLHYMSIGK